MTDEIEINAAGAETERKDRFGTLPPRIRPDDFVGLVETRRGEGRPYSAPSEAQQNAVTSAN
jgi:hypothetical protein